MFDANRFTIKGLLRSYGAQVTDLGILPDNRDAIEKALIAAKAETKKPTIIMLKTHIAHGSPNKQDTADAHGAPLGEEEVCLTKKCLGCAEQAEFCVPMQAQHYMRTCIEKEPP